MYQVLYERTSEGAMGDIVMLQKNNQDVVSYDDRDHSNFMMGQYRPFRVGTEAS